jgi:hypothetical protein
MASFRILSSAFVLHNTMNRGQVSGASAMNSHASQILQGFVPVACGCADRRCGVVRLLSDQLSELDVQLRMSGVWARRARDDMLHWDGRDRMRLQCQGEDDNSVSVLGADNSGD